MPRYDRPDEPYYFDEVIGSSYCYHRPTCHIVRLIFRENYKRFRDYKEAQQLFLKPCSLCRPPFDPSLVRELPPPDQDAPESLEPISISAAHLSNRRRGLVRLLTQIEQTADHPLPEAIAAKISRLAHQNLIPRQVAACMRVITEMRNVVEYQAKTLSSAEAAAVEASWVVIRDWATDTGLSLPPEFEE